jgi:hypothetical protein
MNTHHVATLLLMLMAVCVQGADVALKPGKTQETTSSSRDVRHYAMKRKLEEASSTSFRYTRAGGKFKHIYNGISYIRMPAQATACPVRRADVRICKCTM